MQQEDIKRIVEKAAPGLRSCSFEDFTFMKGLSRESASDSQLFIVTAKHPKYRKESFMKLFVSRIDSTFINTGMWCEIIYYIVVTIMYCEKKLRNIIPMIGYSGSCKLDHIEQFLATANPDYIRLFEYNIQRINDNKSVMAINDTELANIENKYVKLNTDYMFGYIISPLFSTKITLGQYLENNKDSDITLISHFAQIYYTLYVFTMIGLNHNDLHVGNIILDDYYPQEKSVCKFIVDNNNYFITNTPRVFRIFDYDRSTMKQYPNKMLVDEPDYSELGHTVNYIEKIDFAKITCGIVNRIKNKTVIRQLLKCVLKTSKKVFMADFNTRTTERRSKACISKKLLDLELLDTHIRDPIDIVHNFSLLLANETKANSEKEMDIVCV